LQNGGKDQNGEVKTERGGEKRRKRGVGVHYQPGKNKWKRKKKADNGKTICGEIKRRGLFR